MSIFSCKYNSLGADLHCEFILEEIQMCYMLFIWDTKLWPRKYSFNRQLLLKCIGLMVPVSALFCSYSEVTASADVAVCWPRGSSVRQFRSIAAYRRHERSVEQKRRRKEGPCTHGLWQILEGTGTRIQPLPHCRWKFQHAKAWWLHKEKVV